MQLLTLLFTSVTLWWQFISIKMTVKYVPDIKIIFNYFLIINQPEETKITVVRNGAK